jgi:hypothetical protein
VIQRSVRTWPIKTMMCAMKPTQRDEEGEVEGERSPSRPSQCRCVQLLPFERKSRNIQTETKKTNRANKMKILDTVKFTLENDEEGPKENCDHRQHEKTK